MNKIFRSVYNESIGAWVAVSEVDSTKGKKSGSVVNASAESRGRARLSILRLYVQYLYC